jgi:hypothetical protein
VGRKYAGVLGPLAFWTVTMRGLAHQAGVEPTLFSASLYLFVFGGIGFVIGELANWIVVESVQDRIVAELAARSPNEASKK